ncbi:MAG: deoxyribodipyrimidine photolyase-related protein [Paraglaciecola sp.]|jgi:deoxyribodipyrimidine photolyase-related protein
MSTLRLILADQLSHSLASLQDPLSENDLANDWVLMAEVRAEATYVKHHKKKIAFLFSAMRHFANELTALGHQVHYSQYDDPANKGSLFGEVQHFCKQYKVKKIILTHPGEYRVLQDMQSWQDKLGIEVEIRQDSRFLASLEDFAQWAEGRKQLRMEFFYREMRKTWGFLMDGKKPVGDKWNFDSANRKALGKNPVVPKPTIFTPDTITQDVIELVNKHFSHHFGSLENFHFGVTRQQALVVLAEFVSQRLINFGDYQDAMHQGEPWLYHSHISFYLNCGLLLPKEVIELAEQAYHSDAAPLNAVEGFIRQVLGWREYVRGLYWLKMPAYESENFLEASRSLPAFFWDSNTHMNCLHQSVKETQANAYAHHIQRLMVLGNFALLAGLHPDEVNEWFLIVYADAYQWVEMPNVTGMILFADGGLMASKPYAASGSYINKMSNYCQHCHYSVKEKTGPQACPFNYLYWDFLDRNKDKLGKNPRLSMPYRTLEKMTDDKKRTIRQDSQIFFKALDNHEKI